jgi:hypothetical protein
MPWMEITGSGQRNYVQTENFFHNGELRTRVSAATAAVVRRYTTVARDGTLRAVCLAGNLGNDAYPDHTEGGHIIALTNGGADHASNLVPMYGGFNRQIWRAVERDVKQDVAIRRVLITIAYSVADGRMPETFRTYVDTVGTADRDVVGQWTLLSTLHMTTPPAPIAIVLSQAAQDAIIAMLEFAEDNGHTAESIGFDRRYMGDVNSRNYEFLDIARYFDDPGGHYFTLAQEIGALDGINTTIGRGRNFSDHQRKMILACNAYFNDDVIKSDHGNVVVLQGSSTHAAHIDHIVPKTVGTGYNAYSNAQVLTEAQNKAKNG